MSTTAKEQEKRYCQSEQVMCEFATEFGYCRITACANPSVFPKTYTNTTTNYEVINMRLIDADALEKEMCSGCEYNKSKYANCVDCAIANAPTIDAVPVVRCKDCRWWDDMYGDGVKGYCHACKHGYYSPTWEISIQRTTDPDFYCGDGKRREP